MKLKIEKNGSWKEDFNISTFLFWSWVSNTTTNWWHPLEKLKESVYVSWLLIRNHLNDFFGFLLKLWIKNYFQILLTVFLDVMAGASNPKEGRIFFFSFSERFAKKVGHQSALVFVNFIAVHSSQFIFSEMFWSSLRSVKFISSNSYPGSDEYPLPDPTRTFFCYPNPTRTIFHNLRV